jgi:hypothetical protein
MQERRGDEMSKSNGRQVRSFSMYQHEVELLKRLAAQSGLNESEIIREVLSLISDCKITRDELGAIHFERPAFRQAAWGKYVE